jgi:hypothetical protein
MEWWKFERKKKLKIDTQTWLDLFKAYGYDCKNNERWDIVNEVFPK